MESSITNEKVKKVKMKTTNLKFDMQSPSNNSCKVFKASKNVKLKLDVKSHPNDSRGILGAYCTPNEMNEKGKKERNKGVNSDNSREQKEKDIWNEVNEWLQAQRKES